MTEAELIADGKSRFDERQTIAAFVRARGESALSISKRSPDRLPHGEASRLKRWFDTLADDIDAQLHDVEPEERG